MKDIDLYRFAFYVSGNASRLLKVIDQFPEIVKSTVLVVNDEGPNKQLETLLIKNNICYVEFNYESFGLEGREKNIYISNLLLQKLLEHKIDYAFCFGARILGGELLNKFLNKIINFHPAILPMFPGVKSIDQALNANSFLIGNTAHFIDEGIDTGPVIMQSVQHSSQFDVYEDILALQLKMIYQIFIWLNQNRIKVKVNKVHIENANYTQQFFIPKLENDKIQ
ncbi:MAG: hypothetical protein K9G64_04880 [Bacteroidia bacterium]|nr:hypothetical protein [Bacteroidia bacterium]